MKTVAAALAWIADFGIRRRRAILTASAAFVVAAPFFLQGLELDSDAAKILPYQDRLSTAYRQSRSLFGDSNRLVIELRHSDVSLGALNRFTGRLAAVLRSWEDIEYVDIKPLDLAGRDETAARLRAALLNSDLAVFQDFASRFSQKGMRRELLRARKRLIAVDDPELREEVVNDLLDVRGVLLELRKPRVGRTEQNRSSAYFDAPGGESRLIFVQPSGSAQDSAYCRDLMKRLNQAVGALKAEMPAEGIEPYISGVHAMTAEATAMLLSDMKLITAAATGLLLPLLWYCFGRLRTTLICFVPLLIAQLGVLFIARLLFNPIHFVTIGFAAIVVGLGLDVGLHLTGRFTQFLERGSVEDAIRESLADCGPPLLISTTSTCFGFLALLATENRGLMQLGLLTALGLAVTLAITFLLFPPLAMTLSSGRGLPGRALLRGSPSSLFRWVSRKPAAAFAVALALALLIVPFAAQFEFEENVLQLFPDDMDALAAVDQIGETHSQSLASVTQATVHAPDLETAMLLQKSLDNRLIAMVDQGSVALFRSPSEYLPYGIPRRDERGWSELASAVRGGQEDFFDLLRSLRFRDASSYQEYYDMVESAVSDVETWSDPAALMEKVPRLRKHVHASDEGVQLQTYVAVARTEGARHGLDMKRVRQITDDLGSLAAPAGSSVSVSGLTQVYDRANELQIKDFARVSWLAVLLVGIAILAFFRRLLPAALAFLPLAAALPAALAVIVVFDVGLMPSSIGFGAIILGVGIDDAVHILARVRTGTSEEMEKILSEIGPVITLTSASTMVGFGVLTLSRLGVVSSLGVVIAAGVAACWFFSLFLLPGAIRWACRRGWAGTSVAALALFAGLAAQPSFAQTHTASQLMDEMAENLDSVEAVACGIEQVKVLKQLEGAIRMEGPLLYQKPHFIKLELGGDENISLFSDGETIWLVDRDLEDVEKFSIQGADKERRLSSLLPPLFFLTHEEIEERFETSAVPPERWAHRLELTPKSQGDYPFKRLVVDLSGRFRTQRMRMEFENGDSVETRLKNCVKRPRTSRLAFQYLAGRER